jgi:signal transduction histidine kinase
MDDATSPSRPGHEDLAALRRQVADLQAAQTVADQIVETVRDPLLVLTPDFRVQSANPTFYQLFQVRPTETVGQLIYQLGNGQWDIPALRTLLEELLPHNTVFNDYEVTHTFERIGPRTILLNARRLDHVELILLAMEDITVRTQIERQLQQAEHFALLGRLAAGLSHELRNPLGAVLLHVELLQEELRDVAPASAEITQVFTEIQTNLARVDALLQDYLSLVRAGAVSLAPADLRLFVTQFAQEMTPALAAHGITLQLAGLAPLGQVVLHPHTFRRVLLNLVDNARDAMAQGGTLTLQGRRQGATVELDVRDTGSGIAPEHTAQIFEPLHTTKPGGTGLGLYIVREVMTAHGGQVAVQSTVGVGTTFTLTLPLAVAEEVTERRAPASPMTTRHGAGERA